MTLPHNRSNDIVSGLIHLVGAGLAIAVVAVLLVFGARLGTPWHVVGYSVYGAGLILLYGASASYHLIPHKFTRLKKVFQRIDHAIIFFFIAATYTPVTFLALEGVWRWSIFGVVWACALAGASFKLFYPSLERASPIIYIIMGWFIVIAFVPLVNSVTTATLWVAIAGGVSYTVGAIFFALDGILARRRYFWMHEIFHVFVLAGSSLHAVAMFLMLQ